MAGAAAGHDREPQEIICRDRVRIGCRLVGGCVWPHHQAFGVVGGEEITAGRTIGVVAIDGDLDWVGLGQLMREELGWDDYPARPRQLSEAR